MKRPTLSAAATAALLAGRALAAPDAALPAPARLAVLAFPGWSDSAAGRVHTVQVPPGGGGGRTGWHTGPLQVVVEPRLVLRGADEHLTLIAGLVPAAVDGRALAAPATPMALAAYQFERVKGAWRLSARQGIFAWRGFAGAATLRAVTLTGRQQGLGVEYGGCWQGYCGTWLALYELDQGMARREPAVELALSGTNRLGVGDCPRRLRPLVKPGEVEAEAPPRREAGAEEHDCYAIAGNWAVEPGEARPGDLEVRYQGALSRAESRLSPPVAVDQRQVLRYGGGKYRAVSGFNPVPAL